MTHKDEQVYSVSVVTKSVVSSGGERTVSWIPYDPGDLRLHKITGLKDDPEDAVDAWMETWYSNYSGHYIHLLVESEDRTVSYGIYKVTIEEPPPPEFSVTKVNE